MNHLYRDLAPISDDGWGMIDQEATSRLPTYLAARKLVDFAGPNGWSHSATNLGRSSSIVGPSEGVAAAQRRVLPLMELRRNSGSHATSWTTWSGERRTPICPNWTRPCARSRSART